MKRLLTTLVILTGLIGSAGSVWAQDFNKGLKAAQSGDYATALREFKPLAEEGKANAQYSLGVMYREGKGVTQDYAEAVKWYRKAAEQGHAKAQNSLAFRYDKGEGVTQDYAEAVKWYRKAAQQGYARAQSNLGWMYRNGKGVTQDKITAHMWYNIAADNGFLGAVDPRDKVAKMLTVEQLVKANEQEKRCIGDPNVTHNGKVIAYRDCDTKAKSWWKILSEVEPEFDNFLLIIGLVIVFFLLVLIVVIVVLIKKRDSISWRMGSSPGDEPTWNWEETIPFSKSRSSNVDISLEENDTVSSSRKDDALLGSSEKETKFPERDIDPVTPTPSAKDRVDPFRNSVVQHAETSKLKSVIKVGIGVFIAIVTGLYLAYQFGMIS